MHTIITRDCVHVHKLEAGTNMICFRMPNCCMQEIWRASHLERNNLPVHKMIGKMPASDCVPCLVRRVANENIFSREDILIRDPANEAWQEITGRHFPDHLMNWQVVPLQMGRAPNLLHATIWHPKTNHVCACFKLMDMHAITCDDCVHIFDTALEIRNSLERKGK